MKWAVYQIVLGNKHLTIASYNTIQKYIIVL